jgi:glutamine synthetase
VLPASYAYLGPLHAAAANAAKAGIKTVPQVEAANATGKTVADLQKKTAALVSAIGKAEGMHDAMEKQAKFLTADGAEAMAVVRELSDRLELTIGDEYWPLPRYREMLFPV